MNTHQRFRGPVMLALLATVILAGASVVRAADINIYFRAGTPSDARIVSDFSALGPEMVRVPGTRVYYSETDTYDVYRYGSSYYVYDNGYWYRSSRLNRPFVFVQRQSVPRSVIYVPQKYRRHWTVVERSSRWTPPGHGGTPPGQAKKHKRNGSPGGGK